MPSFFHLAQSFLGLGCGERSQPRWRVVDEKWESLQERAAKFQVVGEEERAIACRRRAYRLAFWRFSRCDPRFATSTANAAWADERRGKPRRAARRLARARRLWRALPAWVETMRVAPRARSSLFHMRLEVRRGGRKDAMRRRMRCFIEEGRRALEGSLPAEATSFSVRWRAEKPPTYDDLRKLLSAVLLLSQGQK